MEPTAQKSLERVISQRALQMSGSFTCKIFVLGFFLGVCIAYLLLAAFPLLRAGEFRPVYANSPRTVSPNSSVLNLEIDHSAAPILLKQDEKRSKEFVGIEQPSEVHRAALLYSAWSAELNMSRDHSAELINRVVKEPNVPKPPHLEDCRRNVEINSHFDRRGGNGSLPWWSLWKGRLGLKLLSSASPSQLEQHHLGHRAVLESAYPPWVVGSDEENFPLTRRVQRDLWIHQHPRSCSDPGLRFLMAEWETLPGFGIGAQLAGMAGLLAIAVNENRILITGYYNRADHGSCEGSSRAHWSCYFFPETTQECWDRAHELMKNKEAWDDQIVAVKDNYTSKEIWAGRTPRLWGEPWNYLQPTIDIDGNLLVYHRKMDRRWWRAQALRYLMRFPSEYTCKLLNVARHSAFGLEAAKMVLKTIPSDWRKRNRNTSLSEIEDFVWSNHKPWIPRPMLSMHVRMGDKACEMKVVEFKNYMLLAARVRNRFPHLNCVWLSTEMQEVVNKSKSYPRWRFYYTDVRRQVGNITMASYEASLGREIGTNNPLVNFMMATEADFFIGALGSTWCYLIDGMRNTGGKVMAGYLSVNRDRFW